MASVVDEIGRFPTFELDDQGPNSIARRLVSMNSILGLTRLFLEDFALSIEGRTADDEEQTQLRAMLDNNLAYALALVRGDMLERPNWPAGQDA